MQFRGDCEQAFVVGPEPCVIRKFDRCKQVRVDIADASSHQPMPFDKRHHFVVISHDGMGQFDEKSDDGLAPMEISACQFANDEGMYQNLFIP